MSKKYLSDVETMSGTGWCNYLDDPIECASCCSTNVEDKTKNSVICLDCGSITKIEIGYIKLFRVMVIVFITGNLIT